jgi:hypothetical protein
MEMNGTAYLFAAKMANSFFTHFTSRAARRPVNGGPHSAHRAGSNRVSPSVA